MHETIVALATPPLKSALAVIRLSGEDCFKVASNIFSKDLTRCNKRSIHFGYIKNDDKIVDQVVLLTYVAPHSFTGENSVEIMCHGSPIIANEIIQLLLSKGARLAEHGEFSSRAYLNGKIDLIQAEAINDMINALTSESKDLSLLALQGENSKIFKPITTKIAELIAQIEVNIDYPEYEDIEEISREQVISSCTEIISNLSTLIDKGEKDKIYRNGIRVAIVGKPNVGKSSLLNALIKEDKAIVTPIAGTTRDIVEGDFSLSGVPVHLFDTAGLHDSNDIIENIGINKAKDILNKTDLVIYVIDDTGEDHSLRKYIDNKKTITVYNKADLTKVKKDGLLYISAINNSIEPLLDAIKKVMNIGEVSLKPSFNNDRQLGLLKHMVNSLETAIKDAKNDEPIDLVASSIMIAYNDSLDLLGKNNKNDLTDEIFSRFCVGK